MSILMRLFLQRSMKSIKKERRRPIDPRDQYFSRKGLWARSEKGYLVQRTEDRGQRTDGG